MTAAPVGTKNLYGFHLAELQQLACDSGEKAFRGTQLWEWLQVKHAANWDSMVNVPKTFREKLAENYSIFIGDVVEVAGAPGDTQKLLIRFTDDDWVESVLLPGRERWTVCVSTQAGCRMGCAFCASSKAGFSRNLSAGEIVAQVIQAKLHLGERPDNVVFMGMGEPMDNYEETLRAIRILNHPDGLQIGARRLTLSTAGVVPGIEKLADEGIQFELSVSLHAPNPDIRRGLMPIENKWGMDTLLAACRAYTKKTKRIITFEYTLVKGINDQPEHAQELARRLKPFPCRVNLIPLSPVKEFDGETSDRKSILEFQRILTRRGLNVTLRDSKGKSITSACGQLRLHRKNNPTGQ